jgi:hypothetical protein
MELRDILRGPQPDIDGDGPMIHTETDDFERKRHYQMLKARCLQAAAIRGSAASFTWNEADILTTAKSWFRSITDEDWDPDEEPNE